MSSPRELLSTVDWAHVRARAAAILRWGLPLVALSLLVFTLVLRGSLVETIGVHWDEYNFLSKAYLVARGELSQPLQTFHGHLFFWLLDPRGNEVEQIITARWLMFALSVGMAGLLAYVGQRLIGGSAGVFAAFVFGSFWYVQHHGMAFRYDAIIAPLFIATVASLLTRPARFWPAVLAGVLGGVALLVSIKASVYFPAFAVVAFAPLLYAEDRRHVLARGGVFIASGFVTSALLFLWHRSTLMRVATPTVERAERVYDTMINSAKPFPRQGALLGTLRWDTPMWLLILCGFGILVGGVVYERGRARARYLSALALATPLLSLYLYRNSWPYFYVTILPGTCLLAGAAWRFVEQRAGRRPLLAAVAALLMAVPVARTAWLWHANNSEDENAVHRDIVAAVHEIFPEPVPYIDRCSMVSSYQKAGPFMTTWVMTQVRKRGSNWVAPLLSAHQPKLLINNTSLLDLHKRRPRGKHALSPTDFETLKDNYILHWGSLWVAGKQLDAYPGEGRKFRVLIAGTYTYEGAEPVEIDGQVIEPSGTLELTQGEHRARALGVDTTPVTLRYGDHLLKPSRRPVRRNPLFRGFHAKIPAEKWKDFFSLGGSKDEDEDEDGAEEGEEEERDDDDDDE